MAKSYPRFLFSNPTNTKSIGSYIVHTLNPPFLVKPKFDSKRNIVGYDIMKVWAENHDLLEVYEIADEIPLWFKMSGIQQSSHEDDVLITAVTKLTFLSDYKSEFTVEEARILIRLLFPSKAKKIYLGSSSYGIKHFFEHVSNTIINPNERINKYCNNQTAIEAFELEGFSWVQEGPNRYMNIVAKEINRAYKFFWNT